LEAPSLERGVGRFKRFEHGTDAMSRSQDTIFALSSGSLPAGVAVVRISGAEAATIATKLCGKLPPARQAAVRSIRDRNNMLIDQGLVLFFSAPASFTGEDCVEFQVHGGRASVAALMETLRSFDNVRLADAGEFTRRAFVNGKLDLVEIEGLADLIAAETEMQRRLAIEQSSGRLSRQFEAWMKRLTRCRALIEAELDFSEEEDVPGSVSDSIWPEIGAIAGEIDAHLGGRKTAEIVRDGFKVVIAGRPNAGKSSLLNVMARREVAIVTEIEGTTRDLISVDLDIDGYLVKLTDTAGLRNTDDRIEQEGVRRARQSLVDADLVLLLRESSDPLDYPDIDSTAHILKIETKVDTATQPDGDLTTGDLAISASTGYGIDSLAKRISTVLADKLGYGGEAVAVRQRQVDLLEATVKVLRDCLLRRSRIARRSPATSEPFAWQDYRLRGCRGSARRDLF
jgi:tRNA modification GTPase